MTQIIEFDNHPLNDERVMRHLNYFNKKCDVISINISKSDKVSGECSIGDDIPCYHYNFSGPTFKRRFIFIYMVTFGILINHDIKRFISNHTDYNEKTILHVHDPLLLIGVVLLSKRFKNCRVVYDRHEFFESYRSLGYRNVGNIIYQYLSRLFEKVTKNKLDGVVTVTYDHEPKLKSLFPKSKTAAVPNYPDFSLIDDGYTIDKINSFTDQKPAIRCVYFGTLDNKSRDIDLIIFLADKILSKYDNVEFIIGGKTNDDVINNSFLRLSKQYPDKFKYVGWIPYNQLIIETQKSAIGLFFQRFDGTYWVSGSPNKLYQYIKCGVIPIVRTAVNCDFLKPECVVCNVDDSYDDILSKVESVIDEPSNQLHQRMLGMYNKSRDYSFEKIAGNYDSLYNEI